MRNLTFLLLLLLIARLSTGATAAAAEVGECQLVKASLKRLQCYDKMKNSRPVSSTSVLVEKKPDSTVWTREPTAFLGIKLDQPISDSFTSECPVSGEPGIRLLEFTAGLLVQARCFRDFPDTVPHWARFTGHGIEAFSQEKIFMYRGSLVGKVVVRFQSDKYSNILSSLVQKYGMPTVTEKKMLVLDNGAELPSEVNYWLGRKGVLSIVAIDNRVFILGTAHDSGELAWISTEYLDDSIKNGDRKNQERADKF